MFKNTFFKTLAIASFLLAFSFSGLGQEAEQKPADRSMKIISNRPPEYTSEARAKQLSGWIRLRVTFLDTGAIGDIFYVDESMPDKSLSKAGLLKSSYEAAKRITFQPAIKDGSPVTVTKLVLYNFAIGDRPAGFRVGRRP